MINTNVIRDLLLIIYYLLTLTCTTPATITSTNLCQLSYVISQYCRSLSPAWYLMAHSTSKIAPCVCRSSTAGCWSLFSSHLFSLLCPRLPGLSPAFTISSSTKTCNNGNRHRQPNKHFGERLTKAHNPTDSNNSFAKKRHGQIVTTVCIGLHFVIPIIPPVCYNSIPCHLNTFVKKRKIPLCHSHCK